MCWNEHVSLNTFLFSSFVLGLIIYNNSFTQYKIEELNSIWIYIFIAAFISIQLLEFFIWRNINNKFYNNLFSILTVLLLIIQPVLSLMIISDIQLRNLLVSLYLLLAIPYAAYKFSISYIHSIISSNGHLQWNFFNGAPFIWSIWFFSFLFSFVYEQNWLGLIFGLMTLSISVLNYSHEKTMTSMWCWVANFVMIYYAAYLLIYLPFVEKKKVC